MDILNESRLRDIYGHPKYRARNKELNSLDKHAINFINQSPFIVLSTSDQTGKMDASPRGGQSGFVKVLNEAELAIPDYKGNNRIDSLTNIVETNQIGLLFMIPGIDETLRVNGEAFITASEDILTLFSKESKPPISCIVVHVKEVFLHCAKAFMRSKLWDANTQVTPTGFPTMGEMLKDQIGISGEPESREEMTNRYLKDI